MKKTLIVLIASTALIGAACSSGGSGAAATGGGTSAATAATGTTGSAGGCTAANATDLTGSDPFTVTIQGLAFHPDCFVAKSASSIKMMTGTVIVT